MEELRFEDLTMKCDTMMQDEPCHFAMEVCDFFYREATKATACRR